MNLLKNINRLRFVLCFGGLFGSTNSVSQAQTDTKPNINYKYIDSISHQQHQHKNWNELLKTGKIAQKNHINYYHLHLRLGDAATQTKKYRLANTQYQKAHRLNTFDDVADQRLYWSKKSTHDTEHSDLHASKKSQLSPAFANIFVEYGQKKPSNDTLYQNLYYAQVGFKHRVAKRLSMAYALTNITQKSYYGNAKQQQIFIQTNIALQNGFLVSPAIHWLAITANTKTIKREQEPNQIDTATMHYKPLLASLQIKKSNTFFDLIATQSISNIYTTTELQTTIGLNIYPLANNTFALNANLFLHTIDQYQTINTPFNVGINYATTKTNLNITYLKGSKENVNELNGYLINNATDPTTQRIHIHLSHNICKPINLYALYAIEQKIEFFKHIPYQNQLFLMGIKYNF